MKVQKYTRKQIEVAVKESFSWRETLSKLNPKANYRGSESNLKKRAIKEKIDFSHFLGQAWNKGKSFGPQRPIQEYLSGRFIKSNELKKRLIKEGLKENKCERCNLNEWLSEPIPLELHHVNHNPKDNSLKNLKIVCPNCHYKEHFKVKNELNKNKEKINKKKSLRWRFNPRPQSRKVIRPPLEELERLISLHPMTSVGKMFGVSDNCIRKWLKIYKRPV